MSDFGGVGGALLISEQLSYYRFMDSLSQARRDTDLAVDNANLRQQLINLAQRYDGLVGEYNKLLRHAQAGDNDRGRKTAEIERLSKDVRLLEATVAQMRWETNLDRGEIAHQRLALKKMRQAESKQNPNASARD